MFRKRKTEVRKKKITIWILLLVEHLQHLHRFLCAVARNTLRREREREQESERERERTLITLGLYDKHTAALRLRRGRRTLNAAPLFSRSAAETSRTEPQPPKRSFLQP